jgi:hypothetical protein
MSYTVAKAAGAKRSARLKMREENIVVDKEREPEIEKIWCFFPCSLRRKRET